MECEVYEAPFDLTAEMKDDIFTRYKEGIGWKPMSKFSDPLGAFLPDDPAKQTKAALEQAIIAADKNADQVIDYWRNLAPAITPQAIEELLIAGASLPNVYNLNKKNRGAKNRAETNKALKFGPEKSGGLAGAGGGGGGGGGDRFPGQREGETDSAYAARVNAPPSGEGENYGQPAPVKFPGEWMGPGSDDQYDTSYMKNMGGGNWQDAAGQNYDDKGRIH